MYIYIYNVNLIRFLIIHQKAKEVQVILWVGIEFSNSTIIKNCRKWNLHKRNCTDLGK